MLYRSLLGLCTLLGSCRQSADCGIGTGETLLESDQSLYETIFLGAILKVAPHASSTAEVWALLADPFCRFLIHRVDWTPSKASSTFPFGLAEPLRDSQRRDKTPLWHLLDSSADARQESSFSVQWRSMIQRGWTLVLSWLYPTDDGAAPLPTQRTDELRHSALPTDVTNITTPAPHSSQALQQLVSGVEMLNALTASASSISTPEQLQQRTEEEEEDAEQSPQAPPRRSQRSAASVGGEVVVHLAPVSRRRGKEAREAPEQVKAFSNKSKGKATKTVKSAGTKGKGSTKKTNKEQQRRKKRRMEEELEKQMEEELEKQMEEEEEKQRIEEAEKLIQRREKKRKAAQQKRVEAKRRKLLHSAKVRTRPIRATEGDRTRRGVSPPSAVSSSATVTSPPSSSPHSGPTAIPAVAASTAAASSSPSSQSSPSLSLGPAELHGESSKTENNSEVSDQIPGSSSVVHVHGRSWKDRRPQGGGGRLVQTAAAGLVLDTPKIPKTST